MRERMQRFAKYMEYKGLNDNQVTIACQLSVGLLGKARSGRSDLGGKAVEKILNKYDDLSKIWLLTGEGEMLVEQAPNPRNPPQEEQSDHVIRYFPDVTGSMGDVEWLENPDERFVNIVIPGYRDCQYAINAYGESMAPTITPGTIVLLSEWKESFVEWGKIYVVVTNTGRCTIKRLMPSENPECVSCESDNKASFPPFDVPKAAIKRLFTVHGWVCRDSM